MTYVIQKGFRIFGYPLWFSLGHPEGPEKISFIIDKYENFEIAFKELKRMEERDKDLIYQKERSKYRILSNGYKFKIQKKGWFFIMI